MTGSRLGALLGLYGQEKFTEYWKVLKGGIDQEIETETDFEMNI